MIFRNHAPINRYLSQKSIKMNTYTNFILSLLCMVLSATAIGQNPGTDNITALKLTATVGEQYFKNISIEAFTVDKNNILRPTKDYKITYFAAEKKIAVQLKTMKFTGPQPSIPGFDVKEVPGGTMFCLCDRANDDCKISPRVIDNKLIFSCGGMCGCGSFIIYDTSDPVLGYQTAGGGWFNF